ncbi:MAG: hypothetical protein AVDCRST_MAG66-1862 [uncultured Pseudonocardia sp.]|uniref:Serine protease n=1 Tax=uncultured Pseudonocardia sp. TaxID=211455 RepID=A0A6J4PA11_9PSEU|nr:MAG: hypothetical protein AVDCRST_MAG66-1862 [uncultured Pseudonocardia sp.]
MVRFSRRGAAAGTAAAAVVGVALLVAPGATAAPPAPASPVVAPAPVEVVAPWAPVATAAIRPGVVTETEGGGACTANFVFTAGDRVLLGQAAHCAGTGEATETDGCGSATRGAGTPVTIRAADGTERSGTLAYSSWVTMQGRGETDPDACAYNDFALVEIAPADVAEVNPSLPFFGGPVGVDADGLVAGEQVFTYGNSPLRLGIAGLSPKVGVAADDAGGGRSHEVFTLSPGVPGDSGSGFLDAGGAAVGVLSTLNLAPLPVSNGVTDLARALGYANAHGGLGDVSLVDGTEPFTPEPPGVDPALLATPAGPPLGG